MINASGKTAISRSTASLPMKYLFNNAYLEDYVDSKELSMLDYGCGRGFDADHFGMDKYDLNHFPNKPSKKYDLITCNYVLNVIENPAERQDVIEDIRSMLNPNGVAYISIRRDVKVEGYTSKGTYQENVELDLPVVVEQKGKFITYKLNR